MLRAGGKWWRKEGGWDCAGISFQVHWVCNVRGEEPLNIVVSYCTCTLSTVALSGTPLFAGSKICNGGESIPADPDPSGRGRSETGPGNGDGLRGGYPSPGGWDSWNEVSENWATWPWKGIPLWEFYTSHSQSTSPARPHSGFYLSRVL